MNDELTEKTTGARRNMPMPEGRVIAAISSNFCCESGWSKIEASQSFGLIEVSRPEKVMVRPFEMMELLASVINRLSSPSSLLHHCRPATSCFSPCTVSFVLYIILFLFSFFEAASISPRLSLYTQRACSAARPSAGEPRSKHRALSFSGLYLLHTDTMLVLDHF
jgi:hypothetical protein